MRRLMLALIASFAIATPAMAITVTARVSGGPIPVYSDVGDRTGIVAILEDGVEIPIDRCMSTDQGSYDSYSRPNTFPFNGYQTVFCRIPDLGWVKRSFIVGRGLVNVVPPDHNQ